MSRVTPLRAAPHDETPRDGVLPAGLTEQLRRPVDALVDDGLAALAAAGLLGAETLTGLSAPQERHPDAPPRLFDVLVAVGRADLALGRLFEGHADAVGLVTRLGSPAQRARLAAETTDGGLLGVWGADDPGDPARLEEEGDGFVLRGRKTYCSGAALVHRPIVAAKREGRTQLVLLPGQALKDRFDASWWRPVGMEATRSDALSLDGLTVAPDDLLGTPGAYEGHPAFGAGAIRFVTVQLGGMLGVWDAMRDHLVATGRAGDPHQAARLGRALAEVEGAHAHVRAAYARLGATIAIGAVPTDTSSVCADAARVGVEQAAARLCDLAQRAVGCMGMMRDAPLARVVTDLMVYLRQPAPDAAVTRAGLAAAEGTYVPAFDR